MMTQQPQPAVSLAKSSGEIAQDVIRAIVDSLSSLSSTPGGTGLFPHGAESLGIELKMSAEHVSSVSLKITGARPAGAAASAEIAALDTSFEPAAVFNVEGHQVVALIAMADLAERAPAVGEAVLAILAAAESNRSVKKAAVFPDDIRPEQPETGRFHFINIPLRDGGPATPALPAAPHVITKIEDFTRIVREDAGTAEDRADALSWLFHLFGDIHQPMHCVARFSDLHPDGDRGGNSFRLRGSKRSLHSLWDGAVDLSSSKSAETIADEAMQANTREELAAELAEANPEAWARASFTIAKTFAYTLVEDPDNPPTPSNAYRQTMERIGRRQAALAGYRLADRFRALLG